MSKIGSIIRLVFISVVFFALLIYLTVEPPEKISKEVPTLQNLPKVVELVGYENVEFATKSIIKNDSIIFVGNHESIAIASNLNNLLGLNKGQFVIVSNISDAPWFIKRWQAHTKNEKLKGEEHLPWIYDRDGKIRNFLQVPSSDAVKYFVYKVDKDKTIKRIYIGKVKVGTIDGKFSTKEIDESLLEVVKTIKSKLEK
jgi:hypothetical protein